MHSCRLDAVYWWWRSSRGAPIVTGAVEALLNFAARQARLSTGMLLSMNGRAGLDRLTRLLDAGSGLAPLPAAARTASNRVMGCTAQVWLAAETDAAGRMAFQGWSDSEVSRGLVALLVRGLSGCTPEEVMQVSASQVQQRLSRVLGRSVLPPGRANGLGNMLESARKRAALAAAAAAGRRLDVFPSLLITADALTPQGAFAEAQARYLAPDAAAVSQLVRVCRDKRIGVVAHFYMDPQVQGVLSAAAEEWPHIAISDSLVMADTAVRMAEAGCTTICVLGVDFMSENVRAILDEAGHSAVQVYRLAESDIGCSLAEAAESDSYSRYLQQAADTPNSVHVVYINTSLRTKARAHALVPTITCTSSNVVQTVLAAFADVPGATVWYGPDTYMGANLAQLFADLASGAASDDDVRALHPAHTVDSIRSLLPRLRYFTDGTCIVHHIFGGEVTELVAAGYGDAYLAAHFEVPGEMFRLAMQAKRSRGMGVVGSTSNILDFIADKLREALSAPHPERLQFVLGTEAGMITSIVRKVQGLLRQSGRTDVEVEVVFPVAPSAVATPQQRPQEGAAPLTLPTGLALVPGPASGEGCSLEGGCAACPYMKMNTLAALVSVCERVGSPAGEASLERYRPRTYGGETVGGRSLAAAGCVPILHMRNFQRSQGRRLGPDLLQDIASRHTAR
uniref:Quinolinate synthase, chloroplastic n=1 Tax=Chlamydomonas reinhardtii TaxID=3055 RepID=D5LAX9_CHLRE|nr:NIC7m [Chlamydomonas reinhardtii]